MNNKLCLECEATYGPDNARDVDAECYHCHIGFCVEHIVQHLKEKHDISIPPPPVTKPEEESL